MTGGKVAECSIFSEHGGVLEMEDPFGTEGFSLEGGSFRRSKDNHILIRISTGEKIILKRKQ